MRATFLIDHSYAVAVGESHFDLHNDFDFVGFEYRPSEKTARLEWQGGTGDWVSKTLPCKLVLLFEDVTNLAVQRREDEMPFSEDSCVHSIDFSPPELADTFDVTCPDYRSETEHLSIKFQSGSGIKVWAGSVTHEIQLA